jgi:light-regulated signal transduction histidine kinase (bacteriophytochrome)
MKVKHTVQNYELKIAKLQKELTAKNREVEIEKAFEKVREFAMTMRHSSDLQEVVNLVAQELNNMNLDITGVFMVINNDEIDKQFTFWGSTGVAEIYMKRASIPFLDRPIYRVLAEGTRKPTGEGTGLGLSLTYDIVVKQHGGELKVETAEGEGTSLIIMLPLT